MSPSSTRGFPRWVFAASCRASISDGSLEGLGLAKTGFPAYDRLRLELGIPDGGRDLVPEKSILLEAGFDELNGVDWQKGCYIGQELTARTKYRGLIKKRLMPVEIDGPAPAPGTIITAEGREVGEMRSSSRRARAGAVADRAGRRGQAPEGWRHHDRCLETRLDAPCHDVSREG